MCIVTNLNKTAVKGKQVSFFGIYDGTNGAGKAEFYRDNFHAILYNDEYFLKDLEKSLKRALCVIEKRFAEDTRFKDDQSSTSFVIVIIFEKMFFVLQSG